MTQPLTPGTLQVSTQRRGGRAGTRKASTRLLPPELVLPPPRRLVGFVRLAWDTRAGSEGPWVAGNSRGPHSLARRSVPGGGPLSFLWLLETPAGVWGALFRLDWLPMT